jgi:hypothetical protein
LFPSLAIGAILAGGREIGFLWRSTSTIEAAPPMRRPLRAVCVRSHRSPARHPRVRFFRPRVSPRRSGVRRRKTSVSRAGALVNRCRPQA